MVELTTVPNEQRCLWTQEQHTLSFAGCCPISGNPQPGSTLSIAYEPNGKILEVITLRQYIDSYVGGRGEVRSMEGMIQQIAQDVADAIGTHCKVEASLVIAPAQQMKLVCSAFPAQRFLEL